MGRRRKQPLPRGIRERTYRSGKRAYWVSFVDATGKRVQEVGGTTIEEAKRLLAQRKREVDEGTYQRGGGTGEQTIATYAERWIELRRAEGVRAAHTEESILRTHIIPALGSVRLSTLRPRDVAKWIRGLSRGPLAPKTIRNLHGVLSAMLSRARFDELIVDNPAKGLPRNVLPKDRRAREVGAWTRAEVETFISDERIPEDRRVGYAIAAFTGARVGEVAGMRWRDLDTDARPLWRWALRTQYDGRPLKTEHPRDVPIHPELQRILAAWRLDGWARLMCRVPKPDDFVLPRPAKGRGRRPQHSKVPHHTYNSLGAKAVHRHAAKIGIDSTGRDFHSFRRAMITIARTDGARAELLERVTHNSAGEMIDAYTYFGWEALCSAVSCMRVQVRRGEVIPLRRAAGEDTRGDASGDARGARGGKPSGSSTLRMEAVGVEPTSASGPQHWLLRA